MSMFLKTNALFTAKDISLDNVVVHRPLRLQQESNIITILAKWEIRVGSIME